MLHLANRLRLPNSLAPMIAGFEEWPGYGGLTYQRIKGRSNNGFEGTTCRFQFDIIISDK
jgi:hypothetical protein